MYKNLEQIYPLLGKILNNSEIKVYLTLYSFGVAQTSGVLAKRANIKPSTATMALQSLKKKGIVTSYNDGLREHYSAETPEKILIYLKRKHEEFEKLQNDINDIIPKIKKIRKYKSDIPYIRVYEGIENIKQLFFEMLDYDMLIRGYASLSEFDDPHYDFWRKYYQKVVEKGKKIRMIVPDNEDGREFKKIEDKENREVMLIKHKKVFHTEKHISGDTVAFISMRPGIAIGVLVKDQNLADSEKEFFDLIWESLVINAPQ